MSRTAHVLLTLALAAGTALSSDWPGFRGTGSAVSDEPGLPTTWSKDEGLRWKAALPGRGLSNPVIAAGRVYLTACSGYRQRRLHVLCLDEATGKRLWERQFAATGSTACHPESNMAAPTPVTDGRAVYALFASGDLAALDRDGNLLWYRSLVGDYPQLTNQVGLAASPVLAGDVLCLPMDNVGDSFLAGLDRHTGKNLWRIPRPRELNWVTPLVLDASTVLFQSETAATAVDVRTGKQRWGLKAALSSIPSPSHGEGLVFLTGGQVRAVRPRQEGSEPELLWEVGGLTGGYPSPVYYRGRLYGVTRAAVVCVSAADGKEVWRQRVEGPIDGSPVIGDGKLYLVNNKGRTTVLDVTGDRPKVLARNDLDDRIQATPALANGAVYLRSDRYVYCIAGKR